MADQLTLASYDQTNLPRLGTVNAIETLNGHNLVQYLNGYGIVPPVGANPYATNRIRKEALKTYVGAMG